MKTWAGVLAVVVTLCAVPRGFAGDAAAAGAAKAGHDEKIANIRKLVHIMTGKQMKDMMDKMLQSSFRAVEAQMPPDAREDPEAKQVLQEFMKSASLTEKDLEEMMDLMIPYYDKYLDDADIGALVQFYESPAGKKFVRVMPEMMVEMMPGIMTWQMEKLKGPAEALRKRLEGVEEKRKKEKPAAVPQG